MPRQLLKIYFSADHQHAQAKDLNNFIKRHHKDIIRKIDVRIEFVLVENNELPAMKRKGLRQFPLLVLPNDRQLRGTSKIISFFTRGMKNSRREVPTKNHEQQLRDMMMHGAMTQEEDEGKTDEELTNAARVRSMEAMQKSRANSMKGMPGANFSMTNGGRNKSYLQGPSRNSAPMSHRRENDIGAAGAGYAASGRSKGPPQPPPAARPNNLMVAGRPMPGGPVKPDAHGINERAPDHADRHIANTDYDNAFGVATTFAGDPTYPVDQFNDDQDNMMLSNIMAGADVTRAADDYMR